MWQLKVALRQLQEAAEKGKLLTQEAARHVHNARRRSASALEVLKVEGIVEKVPAGPAERKKAPAKGLGSAKPSKAA